MCSVSLWKWIIGKYRSSSSKVFLGKCVLKICSKFTGEHPCQSAISIKVALLCIFIEITLWHWWSPVNLLHVLLHNTSGGLLLLQDIFISASIIFSQPKIILKVNDIDTSMILVPLSLLLSFVLVFLALVVVSKYCSKTNSP